MIIVSRIHYAALKAIVLKCLITLMWLTKKDEVMGKWGLDRIAINWY